MVCAAIDKAEAELRWCWQALDLKETETPDETVGERLFAFQLRLFDTISTLEDLHHAITRDEKRLVQSKSGLNNEWFKRQMKLYKQYREALVNTTAIGRALGDYFAWIFYEDEHELLAEHRKLPAQRFLPTGVGRAGERTTLDKFQKFNGMLAICHGITTFLRIGDLSFVNVSERRVAALCEIKTERQGNELAISMSFVSDDKSAVPEPTIGNDALKIEMNPTPAMAAKLVRQRRAMGTSIRERQKQQSGVIISKEMDFHHALLQSLVESAHETFECNQAGSSLIIAAARIPGIAKLSAALMPTRRGPNLDRLLSGIEIHARTILDEASSHNCLVLGSIAGDEAGLRTLHDQMPLLSWPLTRQVKEDILFHKVMIVTIYNPAHLWAGLEARGFTLQWKENGRKLKSAVRNIDGRVMNFENIDFFHHLIWHALMSEEAVLNMIDLFIEQSLTVDGGSVGMKLHPRILSGPRRKSKPTHLQ